MALVTCVRCSRQKHIGLLYKGQNTSTDDVLRGTLTCKHPHERSHRPCDGVTVFELVEDALTFYPGRLFEVGSLNGIAPNALEMFGEALLCFYGASYRGVVAFCRPSAEEALAAKGVLARDLNAKIKEAGDYLGAEDRALANAARITGNNALHHLAVVSMANALGALTNTTDFLKAVSTKKPFPEWQSGQDSNAS